MAYYKKEIKFESSRAYMSDPNVSRLFKPVAEKIMKIAKEIQVEGMQFEILKERMELKKRKEIAEKHNLSISTIQYYERAALKKIAKADPELVKELKKIMAMPFTDECKKERKKDYVRRYVELNKDRISLSALYYRMKNPERRKRAYLQYYARNLQQIRERARERYVSGLKRKQQVRRNEEIKKNDYLLLLAEAKKEIYREIEKEAEKYAKILLSPSSNAYSKEEAILAIGARHYRKRFNLLLKYLNSDLLFLKKAVIWSFGEQSEHRSIPYLLSLFDESDPDIKNDIIRAIHNIGTSSALRALLDLKKRQLDFHTKIFLSKSISNFSFRDPKKEMRGKVVSLYLDKLISNSVLKKEDYLEAYKIYSEANLSICKEKAIYSTNFDYNSTLPIPLNQQRRLRTKFYLTKTKDPQILKALMIIETIRDAWGGKFNHYRILHAFEEAEKNQST
ncbi:MAG: HEAT repeat domain-containing protein [Candidatus Micrarchaeota archaeon]|nr:HEAT repeat domain-containing protein [Candidatus Micrarchaeota archaeon]